MLDKVKLALLITSEDFDEELTDLINAAVIDMGIAGIDPNTMSDPDTLTDGILIRAIVSYCGYHFELIHGLIDRANAFKRSYDEQKAQLGMATNYTIWDTNS